MVIRWSNFENSLDFSEINFNTMQRNNKTKEISREKNKDTLLRLKENMVFDEMVKDNPKEYKMFSPMFGFGKMIINIIFHYDIHNVMKDISHIPLICSTGVFKAKIHDMIKEGSQRCDEGGFVLIFWGD